MKGPGFRLDLDVRRLWECPACGRREKMPADVTQLACVCRPDAPPAMRLVERLRKTESPFDQVAFQAQKRIDAVIKKPHGPEPARPVEDLVEADPADLPGANAPSEADYAAHGERPVPPPEESPPEGGDPVADEP